MPITCKECSTELPIDKRQTYNEGGICTKCLDRIEAERRPEHRKIKNYGAIAQANSLFFKKWKAIRSLRRESKMRVYLTGHNGYLGGWVLHFLRKANYEVILSTTNPHPELLEVDAIIHLHWYSKVGNEEPELQEYCYEETSNLVNSFNGVPDRRKPRFIFPSSAAVYGHRAWPRCELSIPHPLCEYGKAKLRAEKVIKHNWGKNHIIFRLGSLMGLGLTRTKTELVVNALAVEGYTKGEIVVWNPEDHKPVIHVQDAAKLLVNAVEPSLFHLNTYNVALTSKKAIEIANLVSQETGAKVVFSAPTPPSPNRSSILSLKRLGREFLLEKKSILEAIREFKDYSPRASDKNTPWDLGVKEDSRIGFKASPFSS